MKKYTVEWKQNTKKWYQRHIDGVYFHYIKNDTEYSVKTEFDTLKEAYTLAPINEEVGQ